MVATSAETRHKALLYGLALIKKGVPPVQAWQLTGEEFGVSKAALYRWFDTVKGQPRGEWVELLASQYKGRTVTASMTPAAWSFFKKRYEEIDPPNIAEAYQEVVAEGLRQKWDVPSENTFRRRMKREGLKARSRYAEN
ncbi:MAG: DNA-binding domain-containing protein [Gammaproteobacteria bacterium]|nr:DNA-binding domain-containing protein [Gammaproteobacteria bacterium]